jgi:CheY-like chemotaxis protein
MHQSTSPDRSSCARCGGPHTCALGDARSTREWFACLTCHYVWSHAARPVTNPSRGIRHPGRTDVVIVDEDAASRDMLERALRGYTVVTAVDGVDGLTRARRCRPAVVVADERLIGLSGSDVLETIRQEYPDAHAVLLTGTGAGVGEHLALDRQVHTLPKRVAVRELRSLITTLIGVRRGIRRQR